MKKTIPVLLATCSSLFLTLSAQAAWSLISGQSPAINVTNTDTETPYSIQVLPGWGYVYSYTLGRCITTYEYQMCLNKNGGLVDGNWQTNYDNGLKTYRSSTSPIAINSTEATAMTNYNSYNSYTPPSTTRKQI